MGYAWTLGIRYLRSKKRAFISVGTLFAIIGVALGVAALATVMSVTGGFQKQFRDKVLGVNAHVLVLKRTPEFLEYRKVMAEVAKVPGVIGVAPFVINPMLVTAGDRTATGVLMKGVDPDRMASVLDLPKHIVEGSTAGLRRPGALPPPRPPGVYDEIVDGDGHALPLPSASASAVPPAASGEPSVGAVGAAPKEAEDPAAAALSAEPPSDPFLALSEKRLAALHKENEALERAIKNDEANSASAASAAATVPPLPAGAIEPDGGYRSDLPTDDVEAKVIESITQSSDLAIADRDLPGVAIGRTLSKNLAVGIGDRIRITSPAVGFSFSGSTHAPVARQFRVIAIFEAGFDQYDSKLVYVDLYESQAFYDQGDSVTGVEMRISDIDKSHQVKANIEKRLNNGLYHVMDWEELNHPLFTALKIQQIGMSAVLALIIVVAAFTVIATLIMIVLDKRKEIAVLKAMGARDEAILLAFLYQGLIIGAIGTALGLVVGLAVCRGLLAYGFPLDPKVYFISRLPVDVRPVEFLVTGGIAMLICLFATIAPALYAAALRPAEGLRAE